jgi:hypothetical protein
MKGLLIGAVIVGAMVDQLAAQGIVTLETGGGAHVPAYFVGSVVALPLGDSVSAPALVISNQGRWGLPYSSAGRYGDSGFADWAYKPPCADKPELCHHGDSGFPDWGYASDPAFYPDNYGDSYTVLPSAFVAIPVIQQADAPPQPTASAPVRSEMREYHWPSSGSDSSATTFSFVSKDGRVQSATAVWVQGNALFYYTPDHSTGRILIDSIDREATRQLNAGKHLNLWLPPERQTDLSLTSGGQ